MLGAQQVVPRVLKPYGAYRFRVFYDLLFHNIATGRDQLLKSLQEQRTKRRIRSNLSFFGIYEIRSTNSCVMILYI